jgi:dihydropteroate synthase
MQSNVFSTNKTLNLRGRIMDLSIPKVMGILNITPDSFYDGGRFLSVDQAVTKCRAMLEEGAEMIDVGGYSSRPGATDISEQEELDRVIPVIEKIVQHFPETSISIDTFRSSVASIAVDGGASIVNDVSGGNLDSNMFPTIASLGVPYILMHSRGTPQTMTSLTQFDNLLTDIAFDLSKKLNQLHSRGVKDIIIDPGFGFAKTIDQNFELLGNLDYFRILEKPLLIGLSRKSMIWKTLAINSKEALNGTTTLNTIALMKGASILRVHDVKEAVECVKLVGRTLQNQPNN